MKIDKYIIDRITEEISKSGQTQASLAKAIGKSGGWVTNLLNGTLDKLNAETALKIQTFLGFEFFCSEENESPYLQKLRMISEDPDYSKFLRELVKLRDKQMDKVAEDYNEVRLKELERVVLDDEIRSEMSQRICEIVNNNSASKDMILPTIIDWFEDFMNFPEKEKSNSLKLLQNKTP